MTGPGAGVLTRIQYVKHGRVATVTLNRPEDRNAMNLVRHEELARVWDDSERADDLWVAVLTGAGDRAFCVGQDLKELTAPSSPGSTGMPTAVDSMGLVNEVVSSDRIDECVGRWIEDVLRCAPLSVRAIKEAATVSATLPLEQAFGTQYEWEARRSASAEAIEGPLAFVAKRDPVWTGS